MKRRAYNENWREDAYRSLEGLLFISIGLTVVVYLVTVLTGYTYLVFGGPILGIFWAGYGMLLSYYRGREKGEQKR